MLCLSMHCPNICCKHVWYHLNDRGVAHHTAHDESPIHSLTSCECRHVSLHPWTNRWNVPTESSPPASEKTCPVHVSENNLGMARRVLCSACPAMALQPPLLTLSPPAISALTRDVIGPYSVGVWSFSHNWRSACDTRRSYPRVVS